MGHVCDVAFWPKGGIRGIANFSLIELMCSVMCLKAMSVSHMQNELIF